MISFREINFKQNLTFGCFNEIFNFFYFFLHDRTALAYERTCMHLLVCVTTCMNVYFLAYLLMGLLVPALICAFSELQQNQ